MPKSGALRKPERDSESKKRPARPLLFGMAPERPKVKTPQDEALLKILRKFKLKPVDVSKLSDEDAAEHEQMLNTRLSSDEEDNDYTEEPLTKWEEFWFFDKKIQEIGDALTDLEKRFSDESGRFFLVLLAQLAASAPAALGADGDAFARIIHALELAVEEGELSLFLDRKAAKGLRGTMAEVAERYLERRKKTLLVGIPRVDFVRWIADHFDPLPRNAKRTAEHVAIQILFRDAKKAMARHAKRGPEGTWREARDRIKAECEAVSFRDPKPIDYARAVLRGWGLSAAEADTWTRQIRRKG